MHKYTQKACGHYLSSDKPCHHCLRKPMLMFVQRPAIYVAVPDYSAVVAKYAPMKARANAETIQALTWALR